MDLNESVAARRSPSVSVVIPTLNAEKPLVGCLGSIRAQDYDGDIEVIVSDGGSVDGTVEVASRYGCRVVDNPNRTGEAGKAWGLKAATGELVALIDSDNILPDAGWLRRMAAPFADPGIAGSEPIEYTYRREDSRLTRYCALLGMNDPICYFFGNYDRMCALSGSWTGLDLETTDRGDYLEVRLREDAIPTIGANGFVVRRALLEEVGVGNYLFDIDAVGSLVALGHDRFAKVKTGIVHLYGSGLRTFKRKQMRRIRDYSFYSARGMRAYPWSSQRRMGLVRFVAYCLTVVPLVAQAARGYVKTGDIGAWALHPPACLITFAVYSYGYLEGRRRPREHDRAGWSQG